MHKSPIDTLYVDLVDACNLACPTCPRGMRYMKNRKGQMSIDKFEKIMRKAALLGFKVIGLYNWTEPLLCKDLYLYTKTIKAHGLMSTFSTNLSFRNVPNLIEILKHTDEIYVSLSGFTQDTYKIHHRGGNIENVKRNLQLIGDAKKSGEISTNVQIKYFDFPYADSEFPSFQQFAADNGLSIVHNKAYGDPLSCREKQNAWVEKYFNVFNEPFFNPPYTACKFTSNAMSIDYNGNVHLCCLKSNSEATKIGNFLEEDFDVLQYRRVSHPACACCTVKRPVAFNDVMLDLCASGMRKSFSRKYEFADRIRDREIYVYGCGEMLDRRSDILEICKPQAILCDAPYHTEESKYGLPVKIAAEALAKTTPLPIVIFAGRNAGQTIMEKIRREFPKFKEIYLCCF